MQTLSNNLVRFLHRSSVVTALAAAVLLVDGCATQSQVENIVAESNAAILAAGVPDVQLQADGSSGGGTRDWQSASHKIDAFIAANPDQRTTIGALRVRQGVLLLANRQYDLAQAAFNAATDLKTDRDKALKALSPWLVWWYQHSADPTLNPLQRDKAREALSAFDAQIAKVRASPDIRDFLAEMRAYIGLKLASEEQGDTKRATFVDTLNRYSEIFTSEDLDVLAQGNLKPASNAVTVTERRRLRAQAVIAKAKRMASSGSLASLTASNLKNPQFAKLVFGS
jgi:hypothetical protein